jgi:hypothetical protein
MCLLDYNQIEFNIIDDDEILYCENSFTEGLVYPLPKVDYTLPLWLYYH